MRILSSGTQLLIEIDGEALWTIPAAICLSA
ncbi:hypothetical protein NBRC3299_2790 [Acetobacter pasteurianus NBRC 3299]|jgi:hypothetical protein|nr:hypothetical protein NBRC3299_2790 [Acetobacter pasteurianus NBRC 3299]